MAAGAWVRVAAAAVVVMLACVSLGFVGSSGSIVLGQGSPPSGVPSIRRISPPQGVVVTPFLKGKVLDRYSKPMVGVTVRVESAFPRGPVMDMLGRSRAMELLPEVSARQNVTDAEGAFSLDVVSKSMNGVHQVVLVLDDGKRGPKPTVPFELGAGGALSEEGFFDSLVVRVRGDVTIRGQVKLQSTAEAVPGARVTLRRFEAPFQSARPDKSSQAGVGDLELAGEVMTVTADDQGVYEATGWFGPRVWTFVEHPGAGFETDRPNSDVLRQLGPMRTISASMTSSPVVKWDVRLYDARTLRFRTSVPTWGVRVVPESNEAPFSRELGANSAYARPDAAGNYEIRWLPRECDHVRLEFPFSCAPPLSPMAMQSGFRFAPVEWKEQGNSIDADLGTLELSRQTARSAYCAGRVTLDGKPAFSLVHHELVSSNMLISALEMSASASSIGSVRPDGSFEVEGDIQDGSLHFGAAVARPDGIRLGLRLRLSKDLPNAHSLTLDLSTAHFRGRVVTSGLSNAVAKRVWLRPSTRLRGDSRVSTGATGSVAVAADGSFEVVGIPKGEYELAIEGTGIAFVPKPIAIAGGEDVVLEAEAGSDVVLEFKQTVPADAPTGGERYRFTTGGAVPGADGTLRVVLKSSSHFEWDAFGRDVTEWSVRAGGGESLTLRGVRVGEVLSLTSLDSRVETDVREIVVSETPTARVKISQAAAPQFLIHVEVAEIGWLSRIQVRSDNGRRAHFPGPGGVRFKSGEKRAIVEIVMHGLPAGPCTLRADFEARSGSRGRKVNVTSTFNVPESRGGTHPVSVAEIVAKQKAEDSESESESEGKR